MDVPHQLQTLLQFLVTDASSIAHLAYILDHLSVSCLAPSPYLQKWVTRVTSLMHSKDPAARWAGLSIAYRMSSLSRSLLVENAQCWIGIIFPFLSKPQPVPILRVIMRYLTLILSAATRDLEFQRQVAAPIVSKVSLELLTLAEKHNDRDIKTLSVRTLTQLIPLYPSLHKALSQRTFALCHEIFSGSVHHTSDYFLDAAADLYAVLHFVGGKVGGTSLWRNCLDEMLQFSWSAWLALRTTFPTSAQLSHKVIAYLHPPEGKRPNPLLQADPTTGNPLATTALNLDRLRCGISAIVGLLRVPVNRPVKVPIGLLAAFCWCLLTSTRDDEGHSDHLDPHARSTESAVISQIWMQACHLLSCLAQTAQELLAPHTSRLITIICSHLENNLQPPERYSLLRCAYYLLHFSPIVGAAVAINRLLKVAISILSPLYLYQPSVEPNQATGQSRSSKKRRREYEVNDVLSTGKITVCPTAVECDTLIMVLDVVDQCMLNVEVTPSTRTLTNRVLLSIMLSLPSIPSSGLSSDPSLHGRVVKKVRDICVTNVQGTSYALSKGAGLVLRSSYENLATRDKLHSYIDLMLHPRRPPYVRTLPFVESLSLSSAEESVEEMTTRQSLDLAFANEEIGRATSEPQAHPKPTIQSSLGPGQHIALNPLQERTSSTSTQPHLQIISNTDAPTTTSVVPAVSPLQTMPDAPVGSPLPKGPTSTVYMAPMFVEESDHEDVPTIDLASDSDT